MGSKVNEVDLREYVNGIAGQMAERIEHQRQVLLKVIDERRDEGQSIEYCPLVDCASRTQYRAAVLDAIQVIEETRRSFKSRQLEDLRKRLENLLTNDAARKF